MGKSKKGAINTREYVGDEECGHTWPASPEDRAITYSDGQGGTYDRPVPVPGEHVCIKSHRHVDDITNDDHECCCGNTQ